MKTLTRVLNEQFSKHSLKEIEKKNKKRIKICIQKAEEATA
jgi:hypothetical protein